MSAEGNWYNTLGVDIETEDGEDWEIVWPEQHELLLHAVKKMTAVFGQQLADDTSSESA